MNNKTVCYWKRVFFFGLCHLSVNGISLSYLYNKFSNNSNNTVFTALVIYNLFAIAILPVFGLIANKIKNSKYFVMIGLIAASLSCFFDFSLLLAAFVLAISNSLVNLGGAKVIFEKSSKIGPLGVYLGVGAIGVGISSFLTIPRFIFSSLSLLMVLIILITQKSNQEITVTENVKPKYKSNQLHIIVIIFLLTAVLFRGFTGALTLATFPMTYKYSILIFIMAVIGKVIGGFISDKLGVTILILSIPSLIIFGYFRDIDYLYIIAVLLFNITMPLILYIVIQCFDKNKSFGYGLYSGTILIGALLGKFMPDSYYSASIILSIIFSIVLIVKGEDILRIKYEYINLSRLYNM